MTIPPPKNGTIYLIHFNSRIGGEGRNGAQHYIGWSGSLPTRLEAHDSGDGAKILAFCRSQGIGFHVVAQWEGDRNLERRMKKSGHYDRRCPVCRAAKALTEIVEASVDLRRQVV